RRQITLAQHRFLEIFDPNLVPGRLYFDQFTVPVRSEMETKLIALIQGSAVMPSEPPESEKDKEPVKKGPGVIVGDDLNEYHAKMAQGRVEVIQHLIENLLKFVLSDEYIKLAKKMEKKIKGDKS
ncbi:MAG: hypothetical protein N2D54_00615, partial [Chloroflexota bacterium]